MKINFAECYAAEQSHIKAFRAANATKDEGGMAVARNAHNELREKIAANGWLAVRLFDEYCEAKRVGNEFIAWDAVIWDKDVESFVQGLRDCGIEKFIFSSGWTSAVETAWKLQENGCKLVGLVEYNGDSKTFGGDDYQKKHGYLFEL